MHQTDVQSSGTPGELSVVRSQGGVGTVVKVGVPLCYCYCGSGTLAAVLVSAVAKRGGGKLSIIHIHAQQLC